MSGDIGRLVKTTSEKCQWCGKGHLQIRSVEVPIMVKGETIMEEKKFLLCPMCDNREEYIDKKQDKRKHREIKQLPDSREVKNGYKERPRTYKRT